MTTNELELVNLIRESECPEKALAKAVDIILLSLTQLGSFEKQVPFVLQELI